MPYDYYDLLRKIRGDDSFKESTDIVRENLWNDTQDFVKAQEWEETYDTIKREYFLDFLFCY